jgi:hypothetical protein
MPKARSQFVTARFMKFPYFSLLINFVKIRTASCPLSVCLSDHLNVRRLCDLSLILLTLTLKMEAACSFETFVSIYEIKRCCNPEGHSLHHNKILK